MKMQAIPIMINGNVQYFDIVYSSKRKENGYIIQSMSKTAIVNEKLEVVSSEMPNDWLHNAIETLKYILDQGLNINFASWI
jgi:hypothetical protein